MPAPASSTNEHAIWVVAKIRRRRFVPGVIRRLPPASPRPAGPIGRREPWNVGEQHGRHHGQPRAEPEHARVHRGFERANGKARGIAGRHGHERLRQHQAQHGARRAEDQALGEQGASERAPARTQRGTQGQFRFTADRPGQDQAGDVRARDDEDDRRRRQEQEEDRPCGRGDLIGERPDLQLNLSPRGIRFGMLAHHRRVHAGRARRVPLPGWRRGPAGRTARSCGACGRSTIVAPRWCGLVTTFAMIWVSAG